MTTVRCEIVRYRLEGQAPSGEMLTLEEISRLVDLHPEMVVRLVDLGLVDPEVGEPEWLFRDTAVPIVWKIMRLHRDLGINWAGIGVVLDLLERIEGLEREIAWLRKQL
ncbi:MAG TPA: chaperone modulator CbpM [Syntrophobacteria bacterium]|nr:chaperone modulator CbpM [Syntrophobacteria bacterium]